MLPAQDVLAGAGPDPVPRAFGPVGGIGDDGAVDHGPGDLLADEAVGDAVEIPHHAYRRVFARPRRPEIRQRVVVRGKGDEAGPLLREGPRRLGIRLLVGPLHVFAQLLHVGELPPQREKLGPPVLARVLDVALLVPPPRVARLYREPVIGREPLHLLRYHLRVPGAEGDDHGLEVVEDDLLPDPSGEPEEGDEPPHHRTPPLVGLQGDEDVVRRRAADRGLVHPDGLAADDQLDLVEIEIHGLAVPVPLPDERLIGLRGGLREMGPDRGFADLESLFPEGPPKKRRGEVLLVAPDGLVPPPVLRDELAEPPLEIPFPNGRAPPGDVHPGRAEGDPLLRGDPRLVALRVDRLHRRPETPQVFPRGVPGDAELLRDRPRRLPLLRHRYHGRFLNHAYHPFRPSNPAIEIDSHKVGQFSNSESAFKWVSFRLAKAGGGDGLYAADRQLGDEPRLKRLPKPLYLALRLRYRRGDDRDPELLAASGEPGAGVPVGGFVPPGRLPVFEDRPAVGVEGLRDAVFPQDLPEHPAMPGERFLAVEAEPHDGARRVVYPAAGRGFRQARSEPGMEAGVDLDELAEALPPGPRGMGVLLLGLPPPFRR